MKKISLIAIATLLGIFSSYAQDEVNPITTAQYPTPAKRPKNSMLNCSKIKNIFEIDLPNWRNALNVVLSELK